MAVNWRQVAYQSAVNAGHPDPDMFVRQMLAESGLRPNAISPAGATGIAQIMPATARGWGVDPNDPYAALGAAAKAMTKYMRSYNGNAAMALAAYNAGPGAVAQYRGVPPYGETKAYIAKIMGGKPTGTTGGPIPQQVPQGPGANPVAVSNQINRIGYAYGEHAALAQPYIDKLTKSLTGASGALANPTLEPAAVGSTEGKGFFARKPGETFQVYMDRLLQKKFGLQHDPGITQTTGGHHMVGSAHYRNGATDYGDARNSDEILAQSLKWTNQNKGNIVGLDRVIDEGDHNHWQGKSGRNIKAPSAISPLARAISPTNSRRRPVRKNRAPK